MEKQELTLMTVAELKALAKKLKVALPSKAKKAEMVNQLMASVSGAPKTSPKKKKEAARKGTGRAAPEPTMPTKVAQPSVTQERVSDSKYYTGSGQPGPQASQPELPRGYGVEKIVLMARDPFWAFAYWEVTPSRIEREKAQLGQDSKLCVRMYDTTGVQFDGSNASSYFDQEVFERVGGWYFELGKPTHSFCVDLGLRTPEGRFVVLARSNQITLPREGVSDVIDEEWMLVEEDFWKLYNFPSGASPLGRELWRRRRVQEVGSPGKFSPNKNKRK